MCCNSDSKSVFFSAGPKARSLLERMLTAVVTVLFSVVVIQWVTSPDQPQASNPSSRNDSHELGSQNLEPDAIVPARRLGSGRRNDLSDLEDFDARDNADGSQSPVSSRRELSTEAMIDGRGAMSISNNSRDQGGSTDTLPSTKPFDVQCTAKPNVFEDKQNGNSHDGHGVALPEEVRVRGSNLYVSRIWRQNP